MFFFSLLRIERKCEKCELFLVLPEMSPELRVKRIFLMTQGTFNCCLRAYLAFVNVHEGG
ncbi:hypothetical protein GJ744_012074 [Endocarpon pusillum]|uniref:Uncharacterized protein n=1 Tax=Endocarpon pusillum TaxID=364733 RepID=A0A8H7AFN8_9EURO|nr:hypothetical protein GJ744_012074 [Endocarpon pusillum]